MTRSKSKKRPKQRESNPTKTPDNSEAGATAAGFNSDTILSSSKINQFERMNQFLIDYSKVVVMSYEDLKKRTEARVGVSLNRVYGWRAIDRNDEAFKKEIEDNPYLGVLPSHMKTFEYKAHLNDLNDIIYGNKNSFKAMSSEHQINTIISLLVLLKYQLLYIEELERNSPGRFKKYIDEYTKQKNNSISKLFNEYDAEKVELHLTGLRWYRTADLILDDSLTEENVNKLYDIAIKTNLMPLKLLLTKHMLRPDRKALLSPAHITELTLSTNQDEATVENYHVSVLGCNISDFALLMRESKNLSDNISYQKQLQWLAYIRPETFFELLPASKSSISGTLQLFCAIILCLAREGKYATSKGYVDFIIKNQSTVYKPTQDELVVLTVLKEQKPLDQYLEPIHRMIERAPNDYVKGFAYIVTWSLFS